MKKILLKKSILIFSIWAFIASGAFAQTWTQKADFSGPGDGGFIFTINNKVYLGGVESNKKFWEYDPATNMWTQKADVPGVTTSRSFATGFAINGKGYVTCGSDGGASTVEEDLWEYDPIANTWTQKANIPGSPRDGAFCFVVNNKAYVGGGFDGVSSVIGDFYEYDPSTNTWTAKANLPNPVIFPFAFSIGSKGYISSGAASSETTNTYEYDPTTDTWTAKASFPGTARQAGFAVALNNKAYCGMGMANYTTVFKDYFSYDPSTDTWHNEGNFPAAGRAWISAAAVGSKGYIGTGWDFGASFDKDWWELAVSTDVPNLNNTNSNLSVYPNPAYNTITLHSDNISIPQNCPYTLFNSLGRVVQQGHLQTTHVIDISSLSTGTYILELQTTQAIYRAMVSVIK
jgi:N-acetylneuraminic acid mutarotase